MNVHDPVPVIDLFGPPAVMAASGRQSLSARKAMALLAYLAMRPGETLTRAHLAGLLWPDSPEEQARTNLRQALSQLRKLFGLVGLDPIEADRDNVLLRAGALRVPARDLWRGALDDPLDFSGLGGFLDGFSAQSAPFDDWANARAREIEARTIAWLQAQAADLEAAGDIPSATAALAEAVRRDPLNEAAHRRLMTLLADSGRPEAALAQFETCRKALARQLDVQPDVQTRRLAAEIRAGRLRADTGDTASGAVMVAHLADGADAPGVRTADDMEAALKAAFAAVQAHGGRAAIFADTTGEAPETRALSMLRDAPETRVIATEEIVQALDHASPYGLVDCGAEGLVGLTQMARHRLQLGNETHEPTDKLSADLSLIILPFQDLSPDAAEYSLGLVLAEELTARVSRYGGMTLAAPTAAQTCRKLGLGPEELRAKLGMNYLVDGSVLRIGDRLRITVSITDLREMSVLWSDRFDGTLDAIFDHQSLLVDRIATLVTRQAEIASLERAEQALTGSMTAFDWYLRGLTRHRRAGLSLDNARKAQQCFMRAIELDPGFVRAYAWRVCSTSWYDPDFALGQGRADIEHALTMSENDPEVQRIAGAQAIMLREYEDGLAHVARAVDLNPSDAYLRATSAVYWSWNGEPDKGLIHMERALALDPFLPVWAVEDHGVMLYSMEDHAAAVSSLRRLSFPTPRALCFMAASQVAQGDLDGAKASIARLKRIDPGYSLGQIEMMTYYRDDRQQQRFLRSLSEAGLT